MVAQQPTESSTPSSEPQSKNNAAWMMSLKPVIFFMVLYVTSLEGMWEFPLRTNTFVVEITTENPVETVELQCNVSEEQQVYWAQDGQKKGDGSTWELTVREKAEVGNFTCHLQNGDIVEHKFILLKISQPTKNKNSLLPDVKHPIHCEAKNYSGHFNCSWKATGNDALYMCHAHRGSVPIPCSAPVRHGSDYVVNCHDHQTCAYEEEIKHIMFSLHVIRGKKYDCHNKTFLLRDIMKPDPPRDLHKHQKSAGVSLEWKYPKTWCNIHTYFPLIFNVNITNEISRKMEYHAEIQDTRLTLPTHGDFKFCVQARDMYHNSPWSEWSCYM
ncbi:interleukin-12 subunit beta [Pelodytes ibericus]